MNLLFHDDWEINGDGTGDPERLMFEPARKILEICDRHGVRYTFFAEVMQQFAMKASPSSQHRAWSAMWETILRDAIRRGHDVQLHLHPQWLGAEYKDGRFHLDYSKWNIARLSETEIFDLLYRGKEYLESLLCPICRDYRVIAVRAGGWMAQPSAGLIRAMRRAGIVADCSVVPGKWMVYRDHGNLDYRQVPSRIMPWWTNGADVATAGAKEEGVLELPTFTEAYGVPLAVHLLKGNLRGLPHYFGIYARKRERDRLRDFTPPLARPPGGGRLSRFFAARSTYGSFGYMHHRSLIKMVRAAQRLAHENGVAEAPLVLLTHSKSFFSFSNFDRFLQRLRSEPGVAFSRTRDCVSRLAEGEIPLLPLSGRTNGRQANPVRKRALVE